MVPQATSPISSEAITTIPVRRAPQMPVQAKCRIHMKETLHNTHNWDAAIRGLVACNSFLSLLENSRLNRARMKMSVDPAKFKMVFTLSSLNSIVSQNP
jgi:hypothetical protein